MNYKNLTFGIEIEFTRIRRSEAATIIADFFDTRPVQRGGWGHDTYEIIDQSGGIWQIVKDASIEPEKKDNGSIVVASDDFQCELVSPVLKYSDIPLLQDLIRDLRKEASTNRSCGIHIHVSAENFSPNALRILCNIMYAKQALLSRALNVNDHRRRYCLHLPNEFIEKLNKKKPQTLEQFAEVWYYGFNANPRRRRDRYNDSRYRILNIHPLLSGRFKTVEFRLYNSALHAGKVKAYIQLSLLIVAQALNQKKATVRVTESENGNDKYTFRVWLLRLGAISDEFKTMRYHLLKELEGNSAWRVPPDT
ncbi:amidoligase family protein [uncultured Brevibacillus sp.]|uniref:amidoligase family protein n=1 Tax=uncultured Brevibacillus sp. TaxID=169970 RepID=UPI00259A440C|nr:amidoligase family protein [uncultured Brevibacillus sp.]